MPAMAVDAPPVGGEPVEAPTASEMPSGPPLPAAVPDPADIAQSFGAAEDKADPEPEREVVPAPAAEEELPPSPASEPEFEPVALESSEVLSESEKFAVAESETAVDTTTDSEASDRSSVEREIAAAIAEAYAAERAAVADHGAGPVDFDLSGDNVDSVAPLEPLLQEETPRRRWPWVLGSIVALLVLATQAAYFFRVELATLQPGLRPLFVSACAQLGCDMPLPRDIRLVDIETSDLNPDPATGRLRLLATLRNRAGYAQELPTLELTLTDTQDRPLARRALAAAEYLPAKADKATGFAAQSELAINLLVEAGSVPASGYRLYLFYP